MESYGLGKAFAIFHFHSVADANWDKIQSYRAAFFNFVRYFVQKDVNMKRFHQRFYLNNMSISTAIK